MKFVYNLRGSAKVALSSAVILILLLAASAATLYGLLAAQESFGQYRLLAHQTKSAAAVEADLLAARLAVQDFIRVGTDDAAAAVRKRVESADTHLDPAVFQDPAKRARAEQADLGSGQYGEAIDRPVPPAA